MTIPPRGGYSQGAILQIMPKGLPRKESVQRKILLRYKIARGHLEKVISMIENGEYCLNAAHQSLAVQAALKKADMELLRNHLNTCVLDSIKKGEGNSAIEEIVKVLEKS